MTGGGGVIISKAATDADGTGQWKARWRRISEKFRARERVGRAESVSEREKLVCLTEEASIVTDVQISPKHPPNAHKIRKVEAVAGTYELNGEAQSGAHGGPCSHPYIPGIVPISF